MTKTIADNNNKKIIPIFFATDDNYAPYLGVTIKSLIDNTSAKNDYIIHILYLNLSSVYQKKISDLSKPNVKINFEHIDEYTSYVEKFKLPENSILTIATYFRLLIPLMFPHYKKLIYADCDIIFLSDIAELFDQDPKDNYFSAVQDVTILQSQFFVDYITKELKITDAKKYFNAGILVFNNEKIVKEKFIDKCFQSIETIGIPLVADQDILNKTAAGKIKMCSFSFNFQWHALFPWLETHSNLQPLKENDIKIIHYTTDKKPWNHPELQLAEYFWKYARETVFYEEIIYQNANKNLLFHVRSLIEAIKQKHTRYLYWKYKLLSYITLGKFRKKYKKNYKQIKTNLKNINNYLKRQN